MRKIILDLTLTLDGFIEGPNGEIDWIVADENADFADTLENILVGIDTIFYGRVSYEAWGNYAPESTASAALKAAYAKLNSKQKYVFSRQKKSFPGAMVIGTDFENQIQHLLSAPGENIWLYGGAALVKTFVNLDLIDVYRLTIQPVILGSGKLLFEDIQNRIRLELEAVHTGTNGVVQLIYRRNRSEN